VRQNEDTPEQLSRRNGLSNACSNGGHALNSGRAQGKRMLAALTRGTLFNVAIWLAALAVFAFVAPPIAVAFAPAEYAVHCLTHDDQGMGMADHDQAVDHHNPGNHEKHGGGGDHKANCCGLFCVTALPASSGHSFEHAWAGTPVSFALQINFSGQTPARLDRPPISRLSF
jgi:hypothetical protein